MSMNGQQKFLYVGNQKRHMGNQKNRTGCPKGKLARKLMSNTVMEQSLSTGSLAGDGAERRQQEREGLRRKKGGGEVESLFTG